MGASRTGFAAAPAAAPCDEHHRQKFAQGTCPRKGILVGAAVEAQLLYSDAGVAQIVMDQCSILVAENSMKMGPMRPTPTTYSFEAGDALVAFGDAHGIKVRGHNLCWHAQLPTWFNARQPRTMRRQVLVDHIVVVAGHYKGKLQSWDVVNEAVNTPDGSRTDCAMGRGMKLLGPEFIPLAFQAARAADPNVLLTYNDYGLETDSDGDIKKRAAILELVRGMQANKVPIDAVGIQSHIHASWSTRTMQRLARVDGHAARHGVEDLRHRAGHQRRHLGDGRPGRDRCSSREGLSRLYGRDGERAGRRGRGYLGRHRCPQLAGGQAPRRPAVLREASSRTGGQA